MQISKLIAPLLAVLAVGALPPARADEASPLPSSGDSVAAVPAGYRLVIGDTLSIVVEGEDVFTRECQVNGAGAISYPKLGDVPAAGLTCGELQARLDEGLRVYLRRPSVTVTVRQYGLTGMSVFVMGEVVKPGPYPLANGTGFLQAVAAAGGLTESASGEISVLKGRTKQAITLTLAEAASSAVTLEPGDVILALRKHDARYAVLGEVARPGMFDLPARGEVRVLDALKQAGVLPAASETPGERTPELLNDPARSADLEHARLTRGNQELPLDLAALLRGDTSQNLALQAGDVLTVPRRAMIRVYAVGEVRTPGLATLPENATVLDLLNRAGGPSTAARPSRATLVRLVGGKPQTRPVNIGDLLSKGDLKHNLTLQDGDVLVIPAQKSPDVPVSTILSALALLTRVPM